MLKALDVKKASGGKRGPKPKPPEQVRGVLMQFLVTPGERERILRASELMGVAIADFIRDTVLPRADRVIERSGG